jgi:hypothetical protein
VFDSAWSDIDTLIGHALRALQDCLPNDVELNIQNTDIAVVGNDQAFTILPEGAVCLCAPRAAHLTRVAAPGAHRTT